MRTDKLRNGGSDRSVLTLPKLQRMEPRVKHSLLIAFSCKRRGVCPSCGAKRAVKFAEHIYSAVIEDVPHRHTVFTIPKRVRVFFKYDRKLNTILLRAAWGSLSQVLGIDAREIAAIFTVQTAGDALNFHPHLHGLLADGFWKDCVFTRFEVVDLKAIEEAFANRVLAQLHKRELITDDDVAQILSQDHTGFGVWLGDPFHDKESEQFVARYIERAPLSLEKLPCFMRTPATVIPQIRLLPKGVSDASSCDVTEAFLSSSRS